MEVHAVRPPQAPGEYLCVHMAREASLLRSGARARWTRLTSTDALATRAMWKTLLKVSLPFSTVISLSAICLGQLLISLAADIISTVEFDQTGNYLATGDKGGRVVLFERNETVRGPRPAVAMDVVLTLAEKNLRV